MQYRILVENTFCIVGIRKTKGDEGYNKTDFGKKSQSPIFAKK
jgi:hypothetical protein